MSKYIRLIVLVVAVVFAVTTQAGALSQGQKKAYDGGVRYFDIETCEATAGGAVTGGNGDGYTAAAPNITDAPLLAEAINSYINDNFPSSPFRNMGGLFISGALRAGINPLAIVAHAQKESQMGTSTQDPQVATAFNAFGRTATASQPHIPGPINAGWYKYESWEKSLDDGGVNDEPTYVRQLHDSLNYNLNSLDYVNSFLGEGTAANEAYKIDMQRIMRIFIEDLAPNAFGNPGDPPTTSSLGSGGGGCMCGPNASTTLVGGDVPEQVWNYFIGKGLSPIQVAAIMGNIQAESGFNPGIIEGGSGAGFGLVQWSFGRRTALEATAREKGVDAADVAFQLDYIWFELEGPEKAAYDAFVAESTLEGATQIFLDRYERAGARKLDERIAFAQAALAQYGSSTAGATTSSGVACATDGSGQIVGGFSLPLERRWFEEHPDWLTKPHHDYPATDLGVPIGTPVFSMTNGTVSSVGAGTGGACGIGITIDAGNGIFFNYCHGSDGGSVEGARQGDQVKAGQLIMHSDTTGNSTGPHLHVGILKGGAKLCPQPLLEGIFNGSPPDVAGLPTGGCTN